MKQSRYAILLFILFVFLDGAMAQGLEELLFGSGNTANYMGQYDFKGKRKNGYGIERYKDGSIYVGDFSKGKVSGRGMLLTFEKGVSNVKGAVIYIGNWVNGKKDGKGVCYDNTGNIVFQGAFSKDKPLNAATVQDVRYFRTIDMYDELYIGEVVEELPNGYGLKLRDDGAIQFGMFRDGALKGVCMTLFSPNVWEVGQWQNGEYRVINNSENSNRRTNEYLELTKEHKEQVKLSLFEATKNFTQAAINAVSIVNDVNGNDSSDSVSADSSDSGESISDGKNYDYYYTKYKIWTSKAYKTYQDGVEYKLKSNDARWRRVGNATSRLLRTQQRMMKQIRTTARKNGHDIPVSEYENVSL